MYLQSGFLASTSWMRAAMVLALVAAAVYVAAPDGERDGSSIMGYGLGGLSAVLVVWLSWLGVMKRRYRARPGRRRNTVSAHVYLGLSLIVIATLHSGFEFEWSVHTLTWVLLMLVILSGIWGIAAYARIPVRQSSNLNRVLVEKARHDLSDKAQLEADLEDIDRRLQRSLGYLPDEFREPVRLSVEDTRLGGGPVAILSGSSRRCATRRALEQVQELAAGLDLPGETQARVTDLMGLMSRKAAIAAALRRDGRYRALLSLWLWFHVPLTVALLATLAAHVTIVFLYW